MLFTVTPAFTYIHTYYTYEVASKRCDHATIEGNLVHDNGRNGIMLHRSCDNATIANNEAFRNGDAGVALFESSDAAVYGNDLHDNTCKLFAPRGGTKKSTPPPYPPHPPPPVLFFSFFLFLF